MTEATSKLACMQLSLLKFDLDVVHRAALKHQTSDALSHLKSDGGDRAKLEDEISVTKIFDQRHTNNGRSKAVSDEQVFDSQENATRKAWPYLPAVSALAEAHTEQPLTLQELLEAYYLDIECWQILKVVRTPRSDFPLHRKGLLLRVGPLDEAVVIYVYIYMRSLPPCNLRLMPLRHTGKPSRGTSYVQQNDHPLLLAIYGK